MGNFKLVNLWQSKEERKGKYWLAKTMGANASLADRMRDWRLCKIERLFGLPITPYREPELERILLHRAAL